MSFIDKLETTDFDSLSKEEVIAIVKMCITVMKSRDVLIERLEESIRLLKETVKAKDTLIALQQDNKKLTKLEKRLDGVEQKVPGTSFF